MGPLGIQLPKIVEQVRGIVRGSHLLKFRWQFAGLTEPGVKMSPQRHSVSLRSIKLIPMFGKLQQGRYQPAMKLALFPISASTCSFAHGYVVYSSAAFAGLHG